MNLVRLAKTAVRLAKLGVQYDPEDLPKLARFTWKLNTKTGYIFAITNYQTLQTVYMHRLVMDAQPGTIVDHRNGDRRDNRKANLRFATATQNTIHRKPPKRTKNPDLPMGVERSGKRFVAGIRLNYKETHLGTFDTVEEAAAAYQAARSKHHGEFA